jgi:stage V sporulation protein G
VKIVRMNLLKTDSKVKAFFSAVVGDFEINDLKLVEGEKGLFVGMPSRSYKDKTNQTKYQNIVTLTNTKTYNELVEAAIIEYERRTGSSVASTRNLKLDDEEETVGASENTDDLPF